MSRVYFDLDIKALLIIIAVAVLFYFVRRRNGNLVAPYIFFSSVKSFPKLMGRARWVNISPALLYVSLFFFACAFVNPRFLVDREQLPQNIGGKIPTEGIAIYLILDQSGSMTEEVSTASGKSIKKIDLLREVTREFITGDPSQGLKGRPNDMIGLVVFARAAHVFAPLTLDHASVLQELSRFAPIPEKDQREQDGTSLGYAIFKTANMIAATKKYAQELIQKGEPAYTIKNSVMILITDGMQDPNPLDKGKRLRNMDVPEAAAYAKEQGIRLYIVNVEPKLATEKFTPSRHIMQRAAAMTGGKFFMVDNTANLEEIYKNIDQLEKSTLPQEVQSSLQKDLRPDLYRRISLYPYFVFAGLLALFASLLLDMTVLRRVP